ncbi:hypothetical protein AB0A95_18195 [Micromonospora sp. NPDC049230]|uniref:hypothetical protein n=1 Tax=Micromonospora sp. NPDC049230 TaxID=3155502 RepID=UPI0033C8AA49
MEPWPPVDDDALTTELGAALWDTGLVSEAYLSAALAAFTWRTADAELAVAELTFDSAVDAGMVGMTRSASSARTLSFRSGSVVVEIEVSDAGIVGQFSPPAGGRVRARSASGIYDEASVDEVGFFSLGVPPPGPVQLCARTVGYTLCTAWVCLR